jgi:hypothetical protein
MRNGGPNVAEVQVHPDPRCQTILEQVREAEIVQAIDRVRPVFNQRRIVVLANLPLDITVDQALPWAQLRPGKFAHAFARHGVLPLSAGDLAKAFPDLWATTKGADNALAAVRNYLKTPNEYIIWGIQVIFTAAMFATYRRKNQRGPAARALVRADLPDPRSVLKGLVGELVDFHIERPPVPAARPHKPTTLPTLPPLAAALSAEAHLLATLPPAVRPPDMLGMGGVLRLMGLTGDPARAERTAAA